MTASYLEERNPHERPARAHTQRWEICWMWPEVREQEAEVGW